MTPYQVTIQAAEAGAPLNIRRHGQGQGGINDKPLSPPVVERIKSLAPYSIRFFVQEYFQMLPTPGKYHWTTIDALIQSVRDTGAIPILSLGMKPACLFPVTDHKLTKPSSWEVWERFIEEMTRHFAVERKWPGLWYEVCNEPDIGELGGSPYLFTPDDYAEFYARTVRAILRVDRTAKVGGPATANCPADLPSFLEALARRSAKEPLPFDFGSWHCYNPSSEGAQEKTRASLQVFHRLGPPFSTAKTMINEWNISWVCNEHFGDFVQSAYVMDWIGRMLDTGLDYSHYYHIMDGEINPEQYRGWMSTGGIGRLHDCWIGSGFRALHLLMPDGEPAAAYLAFQMLYALEGRRIPVERPAPFLGVLATRTERGCRVLVWNYHHAETKTAGVELTFRGLPTVKHKELHYKLGGNLNDGELIYRMRKGQWGLPQETFHPDGSAIVKNLTVAPNSVHCLFVES